jgi:hypothetical protein
VSAEQAKFEGWAIVDVLGHQRYIGFVTTEAYGAAVLFRIDVPELAERERTTVRPGYVNDAYAPAGTVVKESAVKGYTKLVGAGSIYAITPCDREAALTALEQMQHRPLMLVRMPTDAALPSAPSPDAAPRDEEDFDDGDTPF